MNSQRINVGNMDNSISLRDQDSQPSANGAITGDLNQVDELNSSGASFVFLCLDVILDNGQRHMSLNLLDDMLSVPFSQPDGDRALFSSISAPGIGSSLDQEADNRKFFEIAEHEEGSSSQILLYKQRIELLEKKLKALYIENENLKMELRLLRHATQNAPSEPERPTRYWSAAEHKRFLEAIQIFGEDNKSAISLYVGTRSVNQIRSHMQKYKKRMERLSTESGPLINKNALSPLQNEVVNPQSKTAYLESNLDSSVRFVAPLNSGSGNVDHMEGAIETSGNNNDNYNPFSS